MKAGNITGLIAIVIVVAIVGYMFVRDSTGLDGITGQAVIQPSVDITEVIAAQSDVLQQVQPELEANNLDGVCDGFGLVRKKINPDGSIEEYCYDPCNGNQECIANWGNVEEVDFVGGSNNGASSPSAPTPNSDNLGTTENPNPTASTADGDSSSGGGTGSSNKMQL